MPRAFARAFTAASKGLGTRILIWSSFLSNSNRTGLNWEKSSLDRSCARKASASLSLLSLGTFFFIGCNLFRVHIAGRYRADELLSVFVRIVKATNRGSPVLVLPTAIKRFSFSECFGSGAIRGMFLNSASISAMETPCLWHLEPLPSSQSNPVTHRPTIARRLYKCVCKFSRGENHLRGHPCLAGKLPDIVSD